VRPPKRDVAPSRHGLEICDFPRGARAGQCLHDLFERVDFMGLGPKTPRWWRRRWRPWIRSGVGSVRGRDGGARPRLSVGLRGRSALPRGVGRGDRLDELEFHYRSRARPTPAQAIAPGARLRGRHADPDEVQRLSFAPVEGFMRGFVDLVFRKDDRFYLVDYKSNWLGEAAEAYRADRLSASWRGRLLPPVLDLPGGAPRYLGHRLPGIGTSGTLAASFYLFLRGWIPPGPGAGVYRTGPQRRLSWSWTVLATGEEA